MTNANHSGRVYLVGAGPGDPRLITLRGAELLEAADIVFYDGLVNPLLLQLTSGRTERTARTRSGEHAVVRQDEINRRLIEEARAGNCVVRLKGGDPFIFGRGSEELQALQDANVPCEVVPGITAATAAGVYAGFSYTHRDHSSAVAFITGHETPDREHSHLDYAALARFPGTLVFYMGLARLPDICRQLIHHGKDRATPASVVSMASLPDQRVVAASLQNLAATVTEAELRAPSLIVIGECVGQRAAASWFERLPLFGLRIGITRAEHQIAPVAESIIAQGGQPVSLPLISIHPPNEQQRTAVRAAIDEIHTYDWLLFTSANAVDGFLQQLWNSGADSRRLAGLRIAVVGTATAAALEEACLQPDVVAHTAGAAGLADSIASQTTGQRCLWPSADRARPELKNQLETAQATVEQIKVYRHEDADDENDLRERFHAASLDWIGLSSPLIARNAAKVFPELRQPDCPTRVVTISPLTTRAALEAGLSVQAEADDSGWDSMLQAIRHQHGGPES